MPKRSTGELILENDALHKETFDLIHKVIELINIIGWNDDDTYTFANGERWAKHGSDGVPLLFDKETF